MSSRDPPLHPGLPREETLGSEGPSPVTWYLFTESSSYRDQYAFTLSVQPAPFWFPCVKSLVTILQLWAVQGAQDIHEITDLSWRVVA